MTFIFADNPGGNQALDLNSKKELTYKSGSKVKAVFQVSPTSRRFDEDCQYKPPPSLEMPRPT